MALFPALFDLDDSYFHAVVETAATRISNDVPLLVEAVVLNYMALHNEVGNFGTVLPDHGLGNTPADLDALIAFAPIR